MKYQNKTFLLVFTIFSGILFHLSAQPFEGVVTFKKETFSDTTYFCYYVKGDMVRLDQQQVDSETPYDSFLFNLKDKTITAISPSRNLYSNITVKPYIENEDKKFEINKTRTNKNIMGYKCYQWRVRNKSQNTEIAYWVANDNFQFFKEFLKLYNRSEKQFLYFLHIPKNEGFFPMISTERTLLRDVKTTLSVTKIEKKKLDDSLFVIPKDFKSMDRL